MTDGNSEVVTPNVTAVTRPFTERLLRDITSLTAKQQLLLTRNLAAGKMDKVQFKAAAEKAKARIGRRTEAARRLKDVPDEYLERAYERIAKGNIRPPTSTPDTTTAPKGPRSSDRDHICPREGNDRGVGRK